MAKTVSVAEAKRRFSDVVGAVRHGGQRFVIEPPGHASRRDRAGRRPRGAREQGVTRRPRPRRRLPGRQGPPEDPGRGGTDTLALSDTVYDGRSSNQPDCARRTPDLLNRGHRDGASCHPRHRQRVPLRARTGTHGRGLAALRPLPKCTRQTGLIGVQSRDILRPEFWSTWRRAAWDAPCPSPR